MNPLAALFFVRSGDFRQVLPVIPRSSYADIVSASIKNSYLWESIEVFHLSENMRVADAVIVTLILGIALLQIGFFVLATTSWKPSMRTTSSVETCWYSLVQTHEPWLWPSTLDYTMVKPQTNICVNVRFWLLATRRFR